MGVDATPPLADDELEALRIAFEREGLLANQGAPVGQSEWARSARGEAVEAGLPEPDYTLSPRRTLGATRA